MLFPLSVIVLRKSEVERHAMEEEEKGERRKTRTVCMRMFYGIV